MPVPTTGELRFSAIATEFQDTHPIRLSHYFKNNSVINTSHISSFPNTYNEFRLSLFYGKDNNSDGSDIVPEPVESPTKPIAGDLGSTTNYEIITGLYANNTTRSEGTTTFDNRGATGRGSSNNVSYPNLIIQARPGDVINLIGRINTDGNYREYCEFWVWLEGSWSRFASPVAQFYGNRDFSVYYTIPDNTIPGNYNFAVACSYYTLGSSNYRSWKSYSLHVW